MNKSNREEFLNNLDAYLMIAIALVAAVLGVLQIIEIGIAVQAILGTLAILAILILRIRRRLEKLRLVVERLSRQISKPSPVDLLSSWPSLQHEFQDRLRMAKKVSVLAVGPIRFVTEYEEELRGILKNEEGQIRFLLTNPIGNAIELITQGWPESKNENHLCLSHYIPRLKDNNGQNRLVVRTCEFVPTCLITMLDEGQDEGIIFVTMFSRCQVDPMRPAMKFTKRDGVWYKFFVREYEDLGAVGTEISI